MPKTQRSWDVLSEAQRQTAIEAIINYFTTERDEEMGVIAAEQLLDMFLQTSGLDIYNNSVDASKKFVKSQLEELELNMEVNLKKD